MKQNNFVSYSDFGAVGDGKTNDFWALRKAHAYANENGLPVMAERDKTYLITDTEDESGTARFIAIGTDTDWNDCTIIIDDTDIGFEEGPLKNYNRSIFRVDSPIPKIKIEDEETLSKIGALKKTDTKINLKLGYSAMLVIYNSDHRVYVRYGANANSGNPQHELLLVDGEGNIDPTTPIMHDYEKLTQIEVIATELPTLTVKNATVINKASRVNTISYLPDGTRVKNTKYFARNLTVARSNTVIRNVRNYVEGEFTPEEQANGFDGPPYRGFFSASGANNVLIEDCVVSARRYFTPGTYGFGATLVNNIVLKNCKQDNFYLKDENGNSTGINSMEFHPLTKKPISWGLGGTNFCKNMVYDGCEITRFDAHAGLCNGKIINSKVAYINLIGYGEMLIENSRLELKDPTMFQLRRDYGSTWEGTVIIKDCDLAPNEKVIPKDNVYICSAYWANHDFGYKCHFPNLIIDNLRQSERKVPIHIFMYEAASEQFQSLASEPLCHKTVISDGETKNVNPITPPEFIRVINNNDGCKFYMKKLPFFENTEVEGFILED